MASRVPLGGSKFDSAFTSKVVPCISGNLVVEIKLPPQSGSWTPSIKMDYKVLKFSRFSSSWGNVEDVYKGTLLYAHQDFDFDISFCKICIISIVSDKFDCNI